MKKKGRLLSLLSAIPLCATALLGLSACGRPDTTIKPPPGGWTNDLAFVKNFEETVASLSATDDWGRGFSASKQLKNDVPVGIFYGLWFGEHPTEQTNIYDFTEIVKTQAGRDAIWQTNAGNGYVDPTGIAPNGQYYYWAQPLYGYYSSRDPWVMRKHAMILTMCGVDFLFFDASNAVAYYEPSKVILGELAKLQEQGWKVPKVMFMTNSNSFSLVPAIYNEIYKSGKYDGLWFSTHPQGKPMISVARGDINNLKTNATVGNYFDFKISIWPDYGSYTQAELDIGLPWMDWNKFHTSYGGTYNVSIAQHVGLPFSNSVQFSHLYNNNWGRGWNHDEQRNIKEDVVKNTNFEYQWEDVLGKNDLKMVTVQSWNEWTAVKFPVARQPGASVMFVDSCDMEFSRDVEMMKGGYGDNAVIQLAANIRKLKAGGPASAIQKAKAATVDITQKIGQWKDQGKAFRNFEGGAPRNYKNMSRDNPLIYTDDSLRNNIVETRIVNDRDNIFLLIRTYEDLVKDLTSGKWMNVLIEVKGQGGANFANYQYLINRSPNEDGTTSVEKSAGGWAWTNAGTAQYTTGLDYVQIAIPRSALGAAGKNVEITFKVADNVIKPSHFDSADPADHITHFYVTGDAAPVGRFGYYYALAD